MLELQKLVVKLSEKYTGVLTQKELELIKQCAHNTQVCAILRVKNDSNKT